MGCAAAYYLGKAGVRAAVIEAAGVASQASGYNAGGLNPLQGAGLPGPLSELAAASFRMHAELAERLPDESGVAYHHRTIASLNVAFGDADMDALRETHGIFQAADGFSARWLGADELRRIEPRVSGDAACGLYAYGNAALDGREYTLALAGAAERMGAEFVRGKAVGLRTSGENVSAVLLDGGDELACGAVVAAAGPWSAETGKWLGVNIPVEPLKGEIVRLRVAGGLPRHDIVGAGVSLYSRSDGLLWAGATEERRGFDAAPSASARAALLRGAAALMPPLAGAALTRHTACLRPVTPDWLPIFGAAPGWGNAYLATGAGRKGILLSPAIGKAAADLVADGETALPTAGFGAERFG